MTDAFRHLLVPVDFTDQNQDALEVACKLAEQHHAQVTLLHVIETIDYVADEEIDQFYETLKMRASHKMTELAKPFEAAQLPVECQIVLGKRARGIVTYVMNNEVDLVVMSSHRVDLADAPRGWGTLSHQVSILCPCAVLLIR